MFLVDLRGCLAWCASGVNGTLVVDSAYKPLVGKSDNKVLVYQDVFRFNIVV